MKLKTGSIVVTKDLMDWPLYMIIGQAYDELDIDMGWKYIGVQVHIPEDSTKQVVSDLNKIVFIYHSDISVIIGSNKELFNNYIDARFRIIGRINNNFWIQEIGQCYSLEDDVVITKSILDILKDPEIQGKWLIDLASREMSADSAQQILTSIDLHTIGKTYEDKCKHYGIDRYTMMYIQSRLKKIIKENKDTSVT